MINRPEQVVKVCEKIMSQQIKLEIVEDKVKVVTPYHADFVQKCRRLRGKWNDGAWWFDDSVLEYVREAMLEHFNTTGEVPYDEVSLLVKDYTASVRRGPVTLFGRTIAKAFGDDIVVVKGDVNSSGSVKNWTTMVSEATFEIQHFPRPGIELPEVQKAIEEGWVEVKENKKKRPKEEIEAEINALEERISELKAELSHGA
jgi:hypothetical protein